MQGRKLTLTSRRLFNFDFGSYKGLLESQRMISNWNLSNLMTTVIGYGFPFMSYFSNISDEAKLSMAGLISFSCYDQ